MQPLIQCMVSLSAVGFLSVVTMTAVTAQRLVGMHSFTPGTRKTVSFERKDIFFESEVMAEDSVALYNRLSSS